MTGPENSDASTRPISVAELLAKNGTIGAAPPGGRRRRRRGNSDAVTVAELTGEIPIVRTGEIPVVRDEARADEKAAAEAKVEAESAIAPRGNGSSPANAGTAQPEVGTTPPDARPTNRLELADQPAVRRGRTTTPERSHNPLPSRTSAQPRGAELSRVPESVAAAEMMSPDPIVDESLDADLSDAGALDTDLREADEQPDELGIGDASYLQSYLRATSGPLFGGQTVADDLARRGTEDADVTVGEDLEVAEALEEHDEIEIGTLERPSRGQMVVRGLLIAVQSVVAVAFGAGLFIAFDQLWKWNSIVALVLGVLVILGLVVGVRVVRKTEDIGSTLTAVAVGALVTFGPLALLQAS